MAASWAVFSDLMARAGRSTASITTAPELRAAVRDLYRAAPPAEVEQLVSYWCSTAQFFRPPAASAPALVPPPGPPPALPAPTLPPGPPPSLPAPLLSPPASRPPALPVSTQQQQQQPPAWAPPPQQPATPPSWAPPPQQPAVPPPWSPPSQQPALPPTWAPPPRQPSPDVGLGLQPPPALPPQISWASLQQPPANGGQPPVCPDDRRQALPVSTQQQPPAWAPPPQQPSPDVGLGQQQQPPALPTQLSWAPPQPQVDPAQSLQPPALPPQLSWAPPQPQQQPQIDPVQSLQPPAATESDKPGWGLSHAATPEPVGRGDSFGSLRGMPMLPPSSSPLASERQPMRGQLPADPPSASPPALGGQATLARGPQQSQQQQQQQDVVSLGLLAKATAQVEQGQYDAACATVHEALRLAQSPQVKAQGYALRGDARLRAGDPMKAERNASEALDKYDFNCSLAATVLAVSLVEMCQYPRAENVCSRAVALDPTSDRALAARAALHLAMGRMPQAIEDAQKAAAIKPTARVHVILAQAYIGTGNTKAAEEEAKRALSLDPGNADALEIALSSRTQKQASPEAQPPPASLPVVQQDTKPAQPPANSPVKQLAEAQSPQPRPHKKQSQKAQQPSAQLSVWSLPDAVGVAPPGSFTAFVSAVQSNRFLSCNSAGRLLLTERGCLCEKWAIVMGEPGMLPDHVMLLNFAQGVFLCAGERGMYVSARASPNALWSITPAPSQIKSVATGRMLGVVTSSENGLVSPALYPPQDSPFLQWNVVSCAPALYFCNAARKRYLACVVNGEVHTSPLMLAGEKWELEFQSDGSVYMSSVPQNRRLGVNPDGSVYSRNSRDPNTERFFLKRDPPSGHLVIVAATSGCYLAVTEQQKVVTSTTLGPDCLWVPEGAKALREQRAGSIRLKSADGQYLAVAGAGLALSPAPYHWSLENSSTNFVFFIRDAGQKFQGSMYLALDPSQTQVTLVQSPTEWVLEDNNGTVVIRGSKQPSLSIGLIGGTVGITNFPGAVWTVEYQ